MRRTWLCRMGIPLLALLCAFPHASFAAKRTTWAYQGKVAYFTENGKIGLVTKGMGTLTTVAPLLDEVTPFWNGIATVRQGELWGLLDQDGRFIRHPFSVTPVEFSPFDNQYGQYQPEPNYIGILNRMGETVLEPDVYLDAGPVSEGVFAVKTSEGYGYMSLSGETVIGCRYEAALPFTEGLAAARMNGKWGFIDGRGNTVLDFRFAQASYFSQGFAAVKLEPGASTVYIDREGNVALSGNWSEGYDFTKDGLARVVVNGKFGYITVKGRISITPRYEEARDFGSGYAAVRAGGSEWQFIDKQGKIVSKKYLSADPYHDGFAYVTYQADAKTDPVTGYINTGRKFVCEELK